MKKYLSLVLLMNLASMTYGQEVHISYKTLPAIVLQSFRTSYPKARIKNVTKELDKGETTYEISCKDSVINRTISLDADGKIIEKEEELTIDKLPDAVSNAITKKYSKGKIMNIERSDKNSETVYEVLLKDKKKKIEMVFSPDGNIISAK